MSDTKLKPCPFCGCDAEFERIGTPRVSCIVSCTECGARLESGESFGSGNQWNTRKVSIARDIDRKEVELINRISDFVRGSGFSMREEIARAIIERFIKMGGRNE